MSKFSLKFVPVGALDVEGLQTWLEELAQNEGLFPYKLGETTCIFTRGEKKRIRCRLEPVRKAFGYPPESMEALYKEHGWEYCCKTGPFYLFTTDDPDAPELYSDDESRAVSMSDLISFYSSHAWRLSAILLFAFIVLPVFAAVINPSGAQQVLFMFLGIPVLLAISVLYSLIDSFCRAFSLRKIKRQLADGGGFAYTGLPRGRAVITGHAVRLCAYAVTIAVLALMWLVFPKEEPLSPDSGYTLITQLEASENLPLGDDGLFGTEDDNTVTRAMPTLLMPEHVTVVQYGMGAETERTPDIKIPLIGLGQTYYYHPHLTAEYVTMSLPFTVRPTAKALFESLRVVNLPLELREAEYPGADIVMLGTNTDTGKCYIAVIASGRHIAAYRYNGIEDLTDHLDVLAAPVIGRG